MIAMGTGQISGGDAFFDYTFGMMLLSLAIVSSVGTRIWNRDDRRCRISLSHFTWNCWLPTWGDYLCSLIR
jgi:hypothetical protein